MIGAAESRLIDAVAVGTERQMASRQFPLALSAGRIAEHSDAVITDAAGIVEHLAFKSRSYPSGLVTLRTISSTILR